MADGPLGTLSLLCFSSRQYGTNVVEAREHIVSTITTTYGVSEETPAFCREAPNSLAVFKLF